MSKSHPISWWYARIGWICDNIFSLLFPTYAKPVLSWKNSILQAHQESYLHQWVFVSHNPHHKSFGIIFHKFAFSDLSICFIVIIRNRFFDPLPITSNPINLWWIDGIVMIPICITERFMMKIFVATSCYCSEVPTSVFQNSRLLFLQRQDFGCPELRTSFAPCKCSPFFSGSFSSVLTATETPSMDCWHSKTIPTFHTYASAAFLIGKYFDTIWTKALLCVKRVLTNKNCFGYFVKQKRLLFHRFLSLIGIRLKDITI